MKYRKLPIFDELASLPFEDAQRLRQVLVVELMSTKGFQLLTDVLRQLELRALSALRLGQCPPDRVGEMVGRIQCITEIRGSLEALLPDSARPNVDWFDDEDEAFVNVDEVRPLLPLRVNGHADAESTAQ